MKKDNWFEISKLIFEGDSKNKPIFINDQEYRYKIFGYSESKMGFMVIWNVSSNRAIHISRMKIPENFDFVSIESEDYHKHVPDNLIFDDSFI